MRGGPNNGPDPLKKQLPTATNDENTTNLRNTLRAPPVAALGSRGAMYGPQSRVCPPTTIIQLKKYLRTRRRSSEPDNRQAGSQEQKKQQKAY